MFRDVEAACAAVGPVIVAGARSGQGAAVAAALAELAGPVAIVNADLPCVQPDDVAALLAAAPCLVAAADGTTNALALVDARSFEPLYGSGSAVRFATLLGARRLELRNLADDVDTLADLRRVEHRVGAHTRRALSAASVRA